MTQFILTGLLLISHQSDDDWFRMPLEIDQLKANELSLVAQKTLRSLLADNANSRASKIRGFCDTLTITTESTSETMRISLAIALYLKTNSAEARSFELSGRIVNALYSAPGPMLSPIAKEMYIVCALRTSPVPDPKIGAKLLELFPSDKEMQEAFVFDGMHGQMLTKDVARAQGIHRRHFKHLSEEIFLTRDTNLEYALFRRTKSDIHRRAALDGYKKIEKLTKNPEKKDICRSLIRELEQRG